ncbi:hypothetical protein [Rhodopila sp.]|uniref:hypothetical protein n=1 Tax=Rhodopila sp. TaxID=2480087 RepID=UPI003D14ABC4
MANFRSVVFVAAASLGIGLFAGSVAAAPAGQEARPPTAQPAAGVSRVRGVIDVINPHEMRVATRSGHEVSLKLANNATVTWIEPIAVTAIKPGSFIGTAAVKQPDGTLKALEVQVFPESMRGVGEGHRPWDLGADSSMTNGTVGDLKVSNGRTLTLTYKGGEQTVFVPEKAPIITYAPATTAALTKGAHVIVFAMQNPDETLTATRVGVGRNGLVPPM